MLNLEIAHPTGRRLGLSAMRKADRAWFDFAAGSFGQPNVVPDVRGLTCPMVERPGPLAGLYQASYGPTPGQFWWDGDVLVGIHDFGPAVQGPGETYPPECVLRFSIEFANGNSLYCPLFFVY